jgi:integrase
LAKVTVNKFDIIILDGVVDGKRHRLTTGKKLDKRLLGWYTRYADEEFQKLYSKKYDITTTRSITFREYGLVVLEITSSNRNEFSQREETQRFKRLCDTFGDMNIDDIKASDVIRWQNTCGYAPKTIRNYRSIFNLIMEMAHYDELITKNPLKFVKAPKRIYKEIQYFNQDEIKLLIDSATGQFKNILLFNFFAGLRGSELIALRWNDIDFSSNTIRVDTRIRDGVEDVTKSKRVRVIDMLPQARKALKLQQLVTGIRGDYIFVTQYNKGYKTPKVLTELLKSLCIYCDITPGTMHTVRKSCNTLLKQFDMPTDWILDQLGHVDDGVNRQYYTGKIKPDMSKIGRLLAE